MRLLPNLHTALFHLPLIHLSMVWYRDRIFPRI